MSTASPSVPQGRVHHRFDLRSLTYVTLDEANGGIIRNLTHQGAAIQAVGALRAHQQVRLRFELRSPRLRIETRGEVMWANTTGQCGIRFLDPVPQTTSQINEWIFGNLLQSLAQPSPDTESMFGAVHSRSSATAADGLIVSPSARQAIQMESSAFASPISPDGLSISMPGLSSLPDRASNESRVRKVPANAPLLTAQSLAWAVDSLIMVAAFLLFSLVFLSITHELPQWPLSLVVAFSAAIFVPGFYCAFFYMMGGSSLGARLARQATSDQKQAGEEENEDRFR